MKHTHRGTCQWCNAVQAINGGTVAKHGYTVRWGFFEGVCTGSKDEPLQVSCELVKKSIVWAQDKKALVLKQIEALKADTSLVARREVFDRQNRKHVTVNCTFGQTLVTVREHSYWRVSCSFTLNGVDCTVQAAVYEGSTAAEAAAKARATEIQTLAARVASIESYIAFQQQVVDAWAPSELFPVTQEAKAQIVAGVIATVSGRDYTVVRIEERRVHGVGPSLNGQILPHAVLASDSGKEWAYPLRLIRKFRAAA
jgi:hypothetical protein